MRHNKLIDKKLQLSTAYRVIRFYFAAFFVILILMIIHSALADNKINGTIKDLNIAINTEQNIVNAFIKYSDMTSNPDLKLKSQKISDDHTKSIKIIDGHIGVLSGLLTTNFIVISVISVFIILMGLLLFYYLLRLTQTISGPIYVITQQIQDIIDGKKPAVRVLREDDQLKDFYEKFLELTKKIQGNE